MNTTIKSAGRITAKVAAVGAAAGLALLMCGTANAATPAPARAQSSNTTHGFHVYNYTATPLTLASDGGFDNEPATGTVLWPGEGEDLEVTLSVGQKNTGTANYTDAYGNKFKAVFTTEFAYDDSIDASVPTGTGFTASKVGSGPNEGVFFNDGGGTLNIDGQDASVGPMVQNMCSNAVVTCRFDHDVTTRFYAPGRVIASGSNPDTNKHDAPPLLTVGNNDTADSSDTIGVEVNAGGSIAGIVDVGIKGSFSHTWGNSHTFESSFAVTIPAGTSREILAADAMVKDTGNLTMTLNNVTWHINGATFISPDTTTAASYTASVPTPITAG